MATIVIVGAGECGARVAFELRNRGFDGEILLFGEEDTAPYERPPLSKTALAGSEGARFFAEQSRYREANIDLRVGCEISEVDPISKSVRLADGSASDFDKLLFATGARPRLWPGSTITGKRILTLRTLQDSIRLRQNIGPGRKLVIVGGGFIGLEVAATAVKAGTDVTLIEVQSRILGRGVPEDIAQLVAERHFAEGVNLRTGIAILAIEENEKSVSILLQDGTTVEADAALVGIGAEPETKLAMNAGLKIENGIAVNECLETSAENIWAAGDCCSFPLAMQNGRRVRLESWRNAQDQAVVAASNMLGAKSNYSAVPWFWSDQYDMTLQVAGMAPPGCVEITRPVDGFGKLIFSLDTLGRLSQISGIGLGNSIARDIKIGEMLIANQAILDPGELQDPAKKLKSFLP